MLKSAWEIVSAPVVAVWTGKFRGYEVSRNPLHWISLWGWAIVFILVGVVLWPLYVVLVLTAAPFVLLFGHDARSTGAGLEVFSKMRGVIRVYPWCDVASVSEHFDPPAWCAVLKLKNGETARLSGADATMVIRACAERGIEHLPDDA